MIRCADFGGRSGVSGVANAVLDQGAQGAMAITTEAVLTGGLAAYGAKGGIEAVDLQVKSIGTGVSNSSVVVRGGSSPMPAAGETFSGATGKTVQEAGSGVPHGQIRETTAGAVRQNGGQVRSAPEPTRSGAMNNRHVNVVQGKGKPSTFSEPKANPVPKKDRVQ